MGSRIVITTRSENVAKITATNTWYPLKGLPKEKAWSLFVKMAFERSQEPNNNKISKIGKKIATHSHRFYHTISFLLFL